ncbi:Twin-arginine translocation protein TatA/B/E [Corchorus olitorius]|uniref:Twin-arginine translocation protein TatA/B/E n=1 Tax=Corchorus olitorius TaxID=93759 RepID=A0A1R3HMZ4_9ROSI|nr:Twin-arginine translocation protein TatA/B/E [Corchorus olitorius]
MTTITFMASPISTSTFLSTSSVSSKSVTCSFYPLTSYPKASTLRFSILGPALFSQWSGLRHLGISISPKSLKLEKRGKCKGKVIHASLFGVGAPEALVIGVVALLVFGPKGLAEVARTLGKTLRTFQPTIRELQDVSREFKSTLEREIGLDEISSSTQSRSPYLSQTPPTPSPVTETKESGSKADPMMINSAVDCLVMDGTPSVDNAYTSEEYLKITEEQLKASASQEQAPTASPEESQLESKSQPEATPKETGTATPPSQKPESET